MRNVILATLPLALCGFACGTQVPSPTPDDLDTAGATTHFIEAGSAAATSVLALVNDAKVSFVTLDISVRLDRRAAGNIIAHRDGRDETAGTSDDNLFDDITELDAVPYVGQSALLHLAEYAAQNGYLPRDNPGELSPTDKAVAMLACVNQAALTYAMLDDDIGLDKRAAAGIWQHRAGSDDALGTSDDAFFSSLQQLDAVAYVGEKALGALLDYAIQNGFAPTARSAEAIFSPQLYPMSHNTKVAEWIAKAQHSIDIAMYSFSDAAISDALAAAVARGIAVRFIFETANADRKAVDPATTKSGRLEAMGINVRWVNKIMHHKFAIIDGPRDDGRRATSAKMITGSANWSWGAATRYDENTLFFSGYPELTLRLQRQFNLLWDHSRDFVYDATLPYEHSSLEITDDLIAAADGDGDAATGAYFTSNNFSVSGDTFRIVSGIDTVADQLVAAIQKATASIHIASGHLRSRKVAEALLAKRAADPSVGIEIYVDSQEYVSRWYHQQEVSDRADCVVAAGTSVSKLRKCYDRGSHYGIELGDAGIAVRYKYYAYRWDYSYALQMHDKFMIIDDAELWTGSYNLSDNAEHNTFENMLVLRGPGFAGLISAYEDTFAAMWNTSRDDGTLDALVQRVGSDALIPLVFTPMALDWDEITALEATILENCPAVASDPFRVAPAEHELCER